MTWQGFVVDAVFRRGDAHSNHGDTVEKMVCHIVAKIRKHYRAEAAIIVRMDSGFFDQKLFEVFEELAIGYICGSKLYKPIKQYAVQSGFEHWRRHEQGRQIWQYLEFGSKWQNWKRFRRTPFFRLPWRQLGTYAPIRPAAAYLIVSSIRMKVGNTVGK